MCSDKERDPLRIEIIDDEKTAIKLFDKWSGRAGGLLGLIALVVSLLTTCSDRKRTAFEKIYRDVASKKYNGKMLENSVSDILEEDYSVAGFDFSKRWLPEIKCFAGQNLYNTDFSESVLKNADFSKRTNLTKAKFAGADLTGAKLTEAQMSSANLCSADLYGAKLTHAELRNSLLRDACLIFADLSGADMCRSELSGSRVNSAIATNTLLVEAYLDYGDFIHTNFENSNLRDADLTAADLSNANLSFANLHGAILKDTFLGGADLRKAKNLTEEQIESAIGTLETKLPKKFKRPKSWSVERHTIYFEWRDKHNRKIENSIKLLLSKSQEEKASSSKKP